MRKILVAGNWKMNGSSARNDELVSGILSGLDNAANVDVLICPSFPYLAAISEQLDGSRVSLGAQDVSEHEAGAFTGETSAAMLVDVGCRYVIVGHSERRALFGETNSKVAEKVRTALGASLTPILCVGETLAERDGGTTESVIAEQLAAVVAACGIAAFASIVIAYEPVWAIGTGKVATPDQAQQVHRFIRGQIANEDQEIAAAVQILYGGSMKGDNAGGLLGMPDIDGGLIGGASLKSADFLAIARAANNI